MGIVEMSADGRTVYRLPDGALVGVIEPGASPEADRNQTVTSPEPGHGGVWIRISANNRLDADLWGYAPAGRGVTRYIWIEREPGRVCHPERLGIRPENCHRSKTAARVAFRADGGHA